MSNPGTNAGQNPTGQNSVIWGYCRVPTLDQHPEAQADALVAARARPCWTDEGISGGSPLLTRPAFAELLTLAAQGDVILVTKLDRAFRGLPDLLAATAELTNRGLANRALDGSIDTSDTSPTGELTRDILGAVASWERALIAARTREAPAYRRREGVNLGRPSMLTPDDIERARIWRDDGWSYERIGKRLGCSDLTVRRVIAQAFEREGGSSYIRKVISMRSSHASAGISGSIVAANVVGPQVVVAGLNVVVIPVEMARSVVLARVSHLVNLVGLRWGANEGEL